MMIVKRKQQDRVVRPTHMRKKDVKPRKEFHPKKWFFGFVVFNSSFTSFKTTDTYDYDDDQVEDFQIKRGDALFLMPQLCLYQGNADWFFG